MHKCASSRLLRCFAVFALIFASSGLRLAVTNHSTTASRNHSGANSSGQVLTFQSYVDSVTAGRGIWKWSNSLVAYQRHIGVWRNYPVRLGEVGVWSGGSLLMWHAVLGPQCLVYGMDISKDALNFQDPPKTTITLVDQGKPADWDRFFQTATPTLDVLVDDGGHTSPLMLTTTYEAWPHISPGGLLAIEDIHGAVYYESFFKPVAQFYGGTARAELASLHVYPFLLIAQKHSKAGTLMDPSAVPGAVVASRVSSLEQLTSSVQAAPPGSFVVLESTAWDFLSAQSIDWFFQHFNSLHAPTDMFDVPAGCALTNAAACTTRCKNSPQQDKITGIHIFANKLVIELAVKPPMIEAVRHGTEWVKYPTHSFAAARRG